MPDVLDRDDRPPAADAGVDVAGAPGRRRWDVIVVAVVVLLAVLLAVDLPGAGGGDSPAEQAASFLVGFDRVSGTLAADRQAVADAAGEGGDPAGYVRLADAIDDARAGYGRLSPPPALVRDLGTYLASLGTERRATLVVGDVLAGGGDAGTALRDLLDGRTGADNLQRAVRRTAEALAAGAS